MCIILHHLIKKTDTAADSRIETYPGEYDSYFPDTPIGDFVLDMLRKHGDRVACVSFINYIIFESILTVFYVKKT